MSDEKTIEITEENIDLPVVDILTGRAFITGKSGSGKSTSAGVICERLLENNFPLLIVDTEGEYYGLKEKYELLHVGADEDCDLQIGVEHAEKLSELALEKNIPIILDVSGYLDSEKSKELVKETLKHLFNKEKKMKKPFLVLIEEVHEYLPQVTSHDECGKMIIRVGKRGRKRGLGIVGISQRPANVDKDFITQCDWRIWHKLTWKNDTDIVRDVINKDYSNKVKNLDVGEAIFDIEFKNNMIEIVSVNKKETFDAGATPDLEDFERPELKSVSEDLVSELQEISEKKKREQNEIEQLKNKIENRDNKIDEVEENLERAKDLQDMAQQFTEAMSRGGSPELQKKVQEIKEEKNEEIRQLKKENENFEDELKQAKEKASELEEYEEYKDKVEEWEERRDVIKEALTRLRDVLDIEVDEDVEKFKKKLKKKDEKIEEMRGTDVEEFKFSESAEFLEDDTVNEFVNNAINSVSLDEDHFWDTLTYIAQRGKATSKELNPLIDLSRSNISSLLKTLEENRVLKSKRRGNEKVYKLNLEGIEELKNLKRKRQEIRTKSQKLKGDDDG